VVNVVLRASDYVRHVDERFAAGRALVTETDKGAE